MASGISPHDGYHGAFGSDNVRLDKHMWRREKELGYWLSGSKSSGKAGVAFKLKGKLPQKLGLLQFRNIVKEQSLLLDTEAVSVDDELTVASSVYDGLGDITRWTHCELPDEVRETRTSIHDIDLTNETGVQELNLPDLHKARIQNPQMIFDASTRAMPVKLGTVRVRSMECFINRSLEVNDGVQMFWMKPKIRTQLSGIAALPHMRESLNVDEIPERERESFLHEAEALNRIPVEQGEVVAVFRHVPIEEISRLHFLEEKRIILYSISRGPKRSQTRVHDMAAIRNITNREIHLVPHRARYRIVCLN